MGFFSKKRKLVRGKNAVLAVDPARKCGFAIFDKWGLLKESGCMDGTHAMAAAQLMDRTMPAVTVIEDWYLGKEKRKGIKDTAYRNHLWQAVAEVFGVPAVRVTPRTWQAWAKVPGGDKKAIVNRAKALAEQDGYKEKIIQDQGDAIVIGYWFIAESKAGRLVAAT